MGRAETLSAVREKYPQYADMPDETLGNALAAKYPAYKDLAGPDVGIAQRTPDYPGGRQSELRGPEPLWHRLYSEGLPLIGAAGGAALGGPAGPLGVAGGGVGGYTLGRQGVRVIDEVMRRFGQYPFGQGPTAAQTAKEIGKDVAAGAGMEATGIALPGAAGGARRLFQRIAGSEAATPAREAVLAAARAQQIPLTVAAESGSSTAAKVQRVPDITLFGARAMPEAREATRTGAERAVERLVAREGGPLSSEAGGAAVQEDIARRLRLQRQRFGGRVDLRKEGIAGRMKAEQTGLEGQLAVRRQAHETAVAREKDALETSLAAQKQAYDAAIQKHSESLERQIDDMAARMGGEPGMGPRSLGGVVRGGLTTVQQEARRSSTALYNEALREGNPKAPITLTTTQKVAVDMVQMNARLRGVSSSAAPIAKGLAETATARGARMPLAMQGPDIPGALTQQLIEEYGLAKVGTRTLKETVTIQQRLKAKMRRAPDDFTAGEIRQLVKAVDADIHAFAETSGGALKALLEQAIAFNAREVQADFSRKAILRRALNTPPGRLGRQILAMTDGDLAARTMARLPAGEVEQVRRTAFEWLVRKATKAGELDPAALERELSKIAPETRKTIFGLADSDLTRLQTTLRDSAPRRAKAAELLAEAEQQAKAATKAKLDGLKVGLGQAEHQMTRESKQTVAGLTAESRGLPKAFTEPPALAETMRLSPDQVVRDLTRGRAGNVGELPRVWRVLTPGTQQKVRQSLTQSLLDEAKVGGAFSIDRFLTAKRKVPDDVWAAVLHQEPRQALRDITSVLDRIARFDKMSANPSGTSQALISAFEVLRGIQLSGEIGVTLAQGEAPSGRQWTTMGTLIAGPGLVGKAMTSRWARTLFTPSGLASIPPHQRPAAMLVRLLLVPTTQTIQGRVGATPSPEAQEATP